jgi:hypothetical protein
MSNIAWFSGASNPNEFLLAKMDQKANERQLVLGEFGAFSSSTGARSEDVVSLKAERLREGVYKVTPETALALKGEYCVVHVTSARAMGVGKVFDFGIDPK